MKQQEEEQRNCPMSLVMRKPVFGICDQVRLKLTEQPQKLARLEISDTETRDIILSRQPTTKVLIRLRGCAG